MPSFGPWADIPPELLALVGDGHHLLEFYCCAHGVCTAWRAALLPPIPSLVTVTIPPPGASSLYRHFPEEIRLLPMRNDNKPVPKIVFAPNPKPDDYVAIAICDLRRLAYTKTGDMKWMILDVAIREGDKLIDVAYDTDDGKRRRPIVEPLLAECVGLPFNPAAAYAPPYDTASKFTSVKHVFFFGGNLYQVWRNATSACSWLTPDSGRFVMSKDHIFVLKYNPERRPCWDAVTDLGGYSVFIGKNHPMVLQPKNAPSVTANCVYWINEQSRNEPMVFDMVTGTSTLHPSAAKALSPLCKLVCCWYFLDDKITEVQDYGRKRRLISIDHCEKVSKSSRKAH
ncbi:unnamed protein product [Miscanthus lutarioriparius]|uniref:KIB1-4 beta-propeller domain-containing protein n=1 Tax=Miscanthus lutarioriparius TaxID=422564 RepID=A0A811SP75_9POAL|nr:unnamed protein product [Miscanthus lutarioriparius]